MRDIKTLGLKEIKDLLGRCRLPDFYAGEILRWVYQKKARDFSAMTTLPKNLREALSEEFSLFSLRLLEKRSSRDGTEKFLLGLADGGVIEAALIPAQGRSSGCLSSQVGCKFSCRFCASGLLGLRRNLTAAEILEEALYLKDRSQGQRLTHVVFMGIGEPLDNYENVLQAIRLLNAKYGFNIAARRVTISTCGIIPGIKRLAAENLQVELSVSLHAADDKTRSVLMGVNKKYPLAELLLACRGYIRATRRQITFEYALIKGLNSDLPNARKLSTIVKTLGLAKVNLIPANCIEELGLEPPNKLDILLFRDYLLKQGVTVTLRRSRGQDIEASCGQLRLRHADK